MHYVSGPVDFIDQEHLSSYRFPMFPRLHLGSRMISLGEKGNSSIQSEHSRDLRSESAFLAGID